MRTSGIPWRNTAAPVRFFIFDARVLISFFIFALHMCMETFYISIVGAIFFYILERFRITPFVALRFARSFLVGDNRMRDTQYQLRRNCRW